MLTDWPSFVEYDLHSIRIGDRFIDGDGEEYILTRCSDCYVQLTSLKTGTPLANMAANVQYSPYQGGYVWRWPLTQGMWIDIANSSVTPLKQLHNDTGISP